MVSVMGRVETRKTLVGTALPFHTKEARWKGVEK